MAKEHAKIHLLIDGRGNRKLVKVLLENVGFREIDSSLTLSDARKALARNNTDALIVDSTFGNAEVCNLIKDIRSNDTGCNPFIPVIALVEKPRMELVHGLVNSGVDEMVLAPYSAKRLITRIEEVIERRKPFVVTSDYIGPDRRKDDRTDEGMKVPLLQVPNLLKERIEAKTKLNTLQIEYTTREFLEDINLQRIERNADQVVWRVEQLNAEGDWISDKAISAGEEGHLKHIFSVLQETAWRIVRADVPNGPALCENLMELCGKILEHVGQGQSQERAVLMEAALQLQALTSGIAQAAASGPRPGDGLKQRAPEASQMAC